MTNSSSPRRPRSPTSPTGTAGTCGENAISSFSSLGRHQRMGLAFVGFVVIVSFQLRSLTMTDEILQNLTPTSSSSISTTTASEIIASLSLPSFSSFMSLDDDNSNSPTTNHSATTPPLTQQRRFHEIPIHEFERDKLKEMRRGVNLRTSYEDAHVVERGGTGSWFVPQKICRQTCCAETVAISLDQDDKHIINTIDGLDMSDVMIQKYDAYREFHVFGTQLTDELIPCLQPGTIIHIDNHNDLLQYFFQHYRPQITVPFLLTTSESDGDAPLWCCGDHLADDPLLLAWLGQSPNLKWVPPAKREEASKRLIGFPLGISRQHNQDRFLSRYLELNNYTNPFLDKDRWLHSPWMERIESILRIHNNTNTNTTISTATTMNDNNNNMSPEQQQRLIDEAFYQSAFIRFGITRFKPQRAPYFENLCNGYNQLHNSSKLDELSCSLLGGKNALDTYVASSRYLFGFSPEGSGWDCYRTYEFLFVGVIPIIPKRPLGDQGLFDDLPVIQLDDFESNRTRLEYLQIFYDYVKSDEFQTNDFQKGWNRLFLKHWRRKVLDLTDRTKDIIVDPTTGREYYQGWRYRVPPKLQFDLTPEQRAEIEKKH